MSLKYGKFELPQRITRDEDSSKANSARFVAEPFERGFGHTVGNSLRRIMLTSLEAPSIISLSIEGVSHEYMAIEGIVEDMVNIILNLKGALLRRLPQEEEHHAREPKLLSTTLHITQKDLDANKGQCKVTLGDLIKEGLFEVVNPELPIFTVTKPIKKRIDLRVGIGRGYVSSDRHQIRNKNVDEILIDVLYSPVRLVNYFVENTRVGQDTDYDKLILEVKTDGRVTPQEALSFAAQIAHKHYDVFTQLQSMPLSFDEEEGGGAGDDDELMDKLGLRVDEMVELSVRSVNCLRSANIDTIGELVVNSERKMLEFKNFGKKSLYEIKAKLEEMGLYLGMDLSRYGITAENVKEKLAQYREERDLRQKEETEQESPEDSDEE